MSGRAGYEREGLGMSGRPGYEWEGWVRAGGLGMSRNASRRRGSL